MTSVRIECPINPSEDPEKVRNAVLALFPDAEIVMCDGLLRGTAGGLDNFSRIIRRDRILDATRAVLLSGVSGRRARMSLNKQVATVGKVSFATPNPILGAIEVTIEDDDISSLINRVSPETVDGVEVERLRLVNLYDWRRQSGVG